MHDFGWLLIIIGIILTIVTLVGHGIWVVLAKLFGHDGAARRQRCPFCEKYTFGLESGCDWCGRRLTENLMAEFADLEAVERQLLRFGQSGALNREESAQLLARMRDYRRKLLAPPLPARPMTPPTERAVVAEVVEEPIPPVRPVALAQPAAAPTPTPAAIVTHQPLASVAAHQPPPLAPITARQPSPPSKPWAELLASFLEDRNIRWAELIGVLVGGLLIVGSSVALVVSFWDALRETYLKFLVFVGYSSAVFGVGLFAYHRWKLLSTGRGLLVIATLLVPLNFVAMHSLSRESGGWQTATAEIVALGVFAWLTTLAARALVPARRWPLVLVVLGNSALVLLTGLIGQHSSEGMALAANCAPVVLFAVAMSGNAAGMSRRRLQAADAGTSFTLLGMAAFATTVALGVFVAKSGKFLDLSTSLYCLAPPLALAAWPILVSGLQIMRGMARRQSLEGFRTAGIVVALVGVALQLTALGLCWPQPIGLMVIGLVNAASLAFVAIRYRFPAAHAGAMVCFALAYLAGFHLLADSDLWALQSKSLIIHSDDLGQTMLHAVLSARSATSLCGLFLIFAAVAAWFVRRGGTRHATAYGVGCGATAAAAVLLVSMRAIFGSHSDALQAGAIYAFYGVVCVLVSMRWQRVIFSYVGWNLLAIAPFWALHTPLFATWQGTAALAGCLFWLAAVWMLLVWMHRNHELFHAQQCALTAATAVAATAWLQAQPWVASFPRDLVDPRSLQSYGVALGILSLGWIAARIALRGNPVGQSLLNPAEPTVDWFVRHLVIWLQTLLAVAYAAPGVEQEICPRLLGPDAANPWQSAGGPAGWILLGVLAVVLIAAMWERWRSAELVGVLLLAATAPCLAAGRFADQMAVGSALRWGLAASLLMCSVFVWQRHRLLRWSNQAKTNIALDSYGPQIARGTLLAITAWPVIGMTFVAAMLQIASIKLGGPAVGSFFDRLGPNVSYLVPLALVFASLVGYAVRETSAGYAFSAGLVAEMAVVLGYALHVVTDPARTFGISELVTMVQLAAITAAAWGIVWLAVRMQFCELRKLNLNKSPYLALQVALPVVANAVLLVLPVARLLQSPAYLPTWMGHLAGASGWAALLLSAVAVAWYLWQELPKHLLNIIGSLLLGAGVLIACQVTSCNSPLLAAWLEYHVLTTAWAAAALLMLGIGFVVGTPRLPREQISAWVTFLGSLTVVLAMIYSPWDQAGAWWSIRAIGSIVVAATILALWLRSPMHVFLAGLLFNAIGIVAWLAWGNTHDFVQLAHVNVLCLAAASATWTALHLIVSQGVPHVVSDRRPVVFAHLAAGVGLAAMMVMAAFGVVCDLGVVAHAGVTNLAWIALAAVAASIAVTLWDRLATCTLCGLYLAGLTALAMWWDKFPLVPREFCWRAASELAAFVLVAAILGWLLPRAKTAWQLVRIPLEPDRWTTGWFVGLQAVLAAVVAGAALWISIDFAFDGVGREIAIFGIAGRIAGIFDVLMLLGTAILMARQSDQPWRFGWQSAALAAGLLLGCCCGWAALDPNPSLPVGQAPWLHRSVILLVASAIMTLVTTVGLATLLPKTSDWIAAGRRAVPHFGGLTLVVLGLVLAQEVCLFDRNSGTLMASWAIAIVAAALASLVSACITLAVSPQPDPFGLSDRGRQAYVYAAEVLLVLAGLHLRMTMPWLFRLGIIERYWMLLVMGVAFAGAGLSEFFHRRRLPVLSEPLERTALLLPLLPAVGFWFAPDSTWMLAIVGRTPVLWFLIGVFYGSMAYMRRSTGCGALAVLAVNMGLWVGLQQFGVSFFHHPQLWLIPIALAALVAEYLNHDRLSETQSSVFRYLAMCTIYLSSTADMFIAGLGNNWWLPLVLMLLSVAGVLAGLLLRVRSFLLLGIVFLLLDITAMIWHAAVDLDQTWVWYASGIALGAAIITLFALFEKRRNDLLAAIEKLKQWER
jgi:hypothetical protein